MFFHVRDLETRARQFDVELKPGEIDSLDPKLRQAGPLRAAGTVDLVTGALGEIRVKGRVWAAMEADCDRCLEAASFPVDSTFELYYRPVTEDYGEEAGIDQSEAEMGFYEGNGLELNEVLREFVLLALPMQRLCREDCKGLCPVCGQSKNQQECGCRSSAGDERWAALKSFK